MINLIFDYDGTINNCLKTYRPAFGKAYLWLVENGYAEARSFSDEEISFWLGFTGTEMWQRFQSQLSLEVREYCRNIISRETDNQIRSGGAELFEGAEETLMKLKEMNCTLIFLSNCRRHYLEIHNSHLDLTGILTIFIVRKILDLFRSMKYSDALKIIIKEIISLLAIGFMILKQQ